MEEPDRFPAPTLEDVRHDLERLLDYAITPFSLDDATSEALSRYDRQAVLASLRRRVEAFENLDIEAGAYEICAKVLGVPAGEWIRSRWAQWRPETLLPLASATAACLPLDEGFDRVTQVLEDEASVELLKQSRYNGSLNGFALAPFHTENTLDWIECQPELMPHEVWGKVAAASHFSWPRAAAWLKRGRPLSHIALFAIQACVRPDPGQRRDTAPLLEEPAPVEAVLRALDAYYDADRVPRVRRLVESIRDAMLREAR